MNFSRIHEDACAVERVHFEKTDRRVDPKKVDPFLVLGGSAPVLLSAPHSVRHVRDGATKASDECTGALAFLLQRETGCHATAVRKLYGGDPNWDYPCLYKDRLGELARRQGIRLVLDLHGAARDRPFDVDLGTMHGASLLGNRQLKAVFTGAFRAEGMVVSEDFFPAAVQRTVTRFCAEELGVPAVQVEINHCFRAPNRNGADYARLFRALHAIVTRAPG